MTDSPSHSESTDESTHQTLLERHRSPSATEIYTNARSYLFDRNDQVVQVIDDNGDIDNVEKAFSAKPLSRYRSQSTGALGDSSGINSASVPPSSSGVASVSKKLSLDRSRTDNISITKELEKIAPLSSSSSNSKRHLDAKPPKKIASIPQTHASSSDVAKNIVPPLSTTPDLVRHNSKMKQKPSSSTKKLVSRSYADTTTNTGSNGSGAALHTTPPRHTGNLRDDLTYTPSSSDVTSTPPSARANTTPIKDTPPHSHSSKATIAPLKLKGVSASGNNSRTSSPAPADSGRSSRSNSGGNTSQLGIVSISPAVGGAVNMDTLAQKSSGGPLNSGGSNGGNSGSTLGASSVAVAGDGSKSGSGATIAASIAIDVPSAEPNVASGGGGGGGGDTKGSNNPFASTSSRLASFSGAPMDDNNSNVFQSRLQEAQALNRNPTGKEGAVMHEFSLWKNFSKANADNSDIGMDKEDDKVGEVAPPKKSNRVRSPIDRAAEEAIEHSDVDADTGESRRTGSSKRGLKMKTLSPVAATNTNFKPNKASRNKLTSHSKKKNSKMMEPIGNAAYSNSNDDGDDKVGTNMDDVPPSSIALLKPGTNRVSMKPLIAKDKDKHSGSFELEDEHGTMQEFVVLDPPPVTKTPPPLSPCPGVGLSPLPHYQQKNRGHSVRSRNVTSTPAQDDSGDAGDVFASGGGGGSSNRGLARNFRSMVGSCKKSVPSVASQDSILSECSVDITDPYSMHKSRSDGSIASMVSSMNSNYEREGFEEYNDMAILGVAQGRDDDDDDVDLSFISEDDGCLVDPPNEQTSVNAESGVGGYGVCSFDGVQRTLVLIKGEDEDCLEESLDAKELDEEADSLLLSQSYDVSFGSPNPVPFSPRAHQCEKMEGGDSHPPPMAKDRSTKSSCNVFSYEDEEGTGESSVDRSAELVNTSLESIDTIPGAGTVSVAHLLQPIQVIEPGLSSSTFRVPTLPPHPVQKGKNANQLADNVNNTSLDPPFEGGSAPSSSRLPTERTTERLLMHNGKRNIPQLLDDNFNLNTSNCVMSATLGSPPPLRKANLQAKQTLKRNTFQTKSTKDIQKKGSTDEKKKIKSSSKKENTLSNKDSKHKRRHKTQEPSSPQNTTLRHASAQASASSSATAVPSAQGSVSHNRESSLSLSLSLEDEEADTGSVSSELSEISSSSEGEVEYDPENPFPMTEAEKEDLQLQQHKQYIHMGGLGGGKVVKQGALTAPAAMETPGKFDNTGVDATQHQQHSSEEQDKDQMYKLDNGFQWKKGNDVLGQGSFGQVYKGMNYDTGELLAVKQICLNDGTEDEVALLRKEIDVMKDLDHPNIVRYVGTSISSRYLFIVLEYVPGGSVAGTLSQFGAFSEPLIRRFVSQIITGVDYLHQKQIIHRDIKGANVLVTDAGVAKLADFGCSKQLGGMVTASLEESMRIIRGSVPWMAPEVIKQVGHGRSADLWSVGATMIEMATAKHPWPEFSNNLAALFHVATSKDPPPIPSHLSKCCRHFMSRCLVIDPAERASATELMIDPFVQNLP